MKPMSKELVVKTNRLNQAFQTLSLSEFHIVQLAIVDARHTGFCCNGVSKHPFEAVVVSGDLTQRARMMREIFC